MRLTQRIGKVWLASKEAELFSHECVNFSFGRNWQKYLSGLTEPTIQLAEKSFVTFTGLSDLRAYTFLDIGCGSGLSSLLAHRLGARRVVSVDIDPNCIACVTSLRRKFANNANTWDALQGSALDRDFLASLGRFSYVYSWGVLHHTGSMWRAVENVIQCVEPGGKLHIALYNEHRNSARWLKVKRICNRFPRSVLPFLKASYGLLVFARLLAGGQSPAEYTRRYRESRGMSFWRDVEDWLGGLPYEYAKPDHVSDLLSKRGFLLAKLRATDTVGCNEFLFTHAW
jgi:SAM-dependent methyltransferase